MSTLSPWKIRLGAVPPLDTEAMHRAEARLDDLPKPRGSLGLPESLIVHLAGISDHVALVSTSP